MIANKSGTGGNIGYIDYSTSAIGESIFQSSADPTTYETLSNILLLKPIKIVNTPLLLPLLYDLQPSIKKIFDTYDEALRKLADL